MSIQSITKKRVAAAVATLSITGAGLAVSGLGSESSVQLKAGKPGVQRAAPVAAGSENAINGARVRLVARHVGLGHYIIERAGSTTAIERTTDTAMAQEYTVTSEAAAAAGTTVSDTGEQPNRPSRVRVPHKVEVGLPSYEGGRPPSATAPSVDRGTAPSVDPGWTTTVDLGEAPSASAPSVDPGDMGTIHQPTVHVS